MTTSETPTDNGVNVQALLDARAALTDAPEARPVHLARQQPVGQRHAQPKRDHRLLRPGRRPQPSLHVVLRRRPPGGLRIRGHRSDARRVRARRPGELSHRRRRRGRAEPRHPAQRREATIEGDMDILGILGADPDVRNGFNGIRVHYEIDADATPRRSRPSSPSRRSDQPSSTWSRTRRASRFRSTEPLLAPGAHDDRRHRSGTLGSGSQSLPLPALDRPRGPRARGGCQRVADPALGRAPAAHAQLAEPAARLRLRGRATPTAS